MHFRYLLWDFDGTLFDTYPPLAESIERALADFDATEPRAAINALLSQTLDLTLTTLVDKFALDHDAFKQRLYHYWEQVPLDAYTPFPGVIAFCERFIAANGQHYIYTHRGRATMMPMLEQHNVTHLFAGSMTRDNGYPRKPDPTGFNALIDHYNLPRAELLTIGDRDLDIQAGQAAGIKACLFNAQPGPGVEPDYVIASFAELDAIVEL
ncbi:MAG: HAD hydrolase-like protein [Anaerolineae bacterium]|nr:HAD hydrolase-like protein [Anaerolineae bacterium]